MENKERDYKEERFEFTLYVNDNIICKRNFRIFNFIENSMNTAEFKETVDEIVRMIDNDLKSKSRVYTWYYFNPNDVIEGDEFDSKLIEPWACTFKFVVSDNKRDVITKIWDGYAYPKSIREKVDLSNKWVKIQNREGQTFVYEKESFFNEHAGKLSFELEALRGMIMDKQDVLLQITKKICEACSPSREEIKENGFMDYKDNAKYLSSYTTISEYKTPGDKNATKRYPLSLYQINKKVERDWEKATQSKTRKYFNSKG